MTLSEYVRAMGRGPSRGRSLTREEAEDALGLILDGRAAPEAAGALLMLMRYRGETADEVAGFTSAARARARGWADVGAALDWPSYAAGRSRGLPWFVLAALLVAQAGHPLLLHGWNSHQNPIADVRRAVAEVGIPVVETPAAAERALAKAGVAYAPLEAISADLLRVLQLRNVLGLRSAVNTVCRMLNPAGAAAGVQGVFHPSYRELQQDAGALLGQRNLMVLKGGGGEFERHPAKTVTLHGLAEGTPFETQAAPLVQAHRRLADTSKGTPHLGAVWRGETQDPWAEAVVLGTIAAALLAVEPARTLAEAEITARELWHARAPLAIA